MYIRTFHFGNQLVTNNDSASRINFLDLIIPWIKVHCAIQWKQHVTQITSTHHVVQSVMKRVMLSGPDYVVVTRFGVAQEAWSLEISSMQLFILNWVFIWCLLLYQILRACEVSRLRCDKSMKQSGSLSLKSSRWTLEGIESRLKHNHLDYLEFPNGRKDKGIALMVLFWEIF